MSKLIPAPTVSGFLPPIPRNSQAAKPADDDRASHQRAQHALEQHLQELLDSQSSGLAFQLGEPGASIDDHGTAEMQLKPRISLSDARRGIGTAIRKLARLKSAEAEVIHDRSEQFLDLLNQTSEWSEQRQGLQDDIERIDHSEQDGLIESLTEEDGMVQEQINAMEEKLSQLRSHQRQIRARVSQLQNSKSAQLSSYRTSMSTLNAEIERFLRRPLPDSGLQTDSTALTIERLPPGRRTLEMVMNYAREASSALYTILQRLQSDHDALTAGTTLWERAIDVVETFESELRQATKKLHAGSGPNNVHQHALAARKTSPSSEGPADVLKNMHDAGQRLEAMLNQAEDKGWNLLIAAVSFNSSRLFCLPKSGFHTDHDCRLVPSWRPSDRDRSF